MSLVFIRLEMYFPPGDNFFQEILILFRVELFEYGIQYYTYIRLSRQTLVGELCDTQVFSSITVIHFFDFVMELTCTRPMADSPLPLLVRCIPSVVGLE